MQSTLFTKKNIIGAIFILIIVVMAGFFFFSLDPVAAAPANDGAVPVIFQVSPGDGFRTVAENLYTAGLIRSPISFDLFSLIDGRAFTLKPGLYKLYPSMDTAQILSALSGGGAGEATVTIPEGSNIFDIDRILSDRARDPPRSAHQLYEHAKSGRATFPGHLSVLYERERGGCGDRDDG